MMSFTRESLDEMNIHQLREFGRRMGLSSPSSLKREDLVKQILDVQSGAVKPAPRSNRGRPPKTFDDVTLLTADPILSDVAPSIEDDDVVPEKEESGAITEEEREGILEIHANGYGFARVKNFESGRGDVYVSQQLIKSLRLKKGDLVRGKIRLRNETGEPSMYFVSTVNGMTIDKVIGRTDFDDLVPIFPNERLDMETKGNDLALRCIDLIAPIGKGQRALIVSPPKAGKTTLLKKIARAIEQNNPEVKLFILLIDERPEEVTDMKRCVGAEVVSSTFDEAPEHHTRAAELLLARAKRLVEMGQDVVILLDSITRLARAYNLTVPQSGRSLSGGLDPVALHYPKRFFGSARNIEDGGSLTVIATALIDTGSRMDDIIYEEFKGTGNMEIHLDRQLSDRRIFPAIDLCRSGTRKEDLLLTKKELECMYTMRRVLANGNLVDSTEQLLSMMEKSRDNADFVEKLPEWMKLAFQTK